MEIGIKQIGRYLGTQFGGVSPGADRIHWPLIDHLEGPGPNMDRDISTATALTLLIDKAQADMSKGAPNVRKDFNDAARSGAAGFLRFGGNCHLITSTTSYRLVPACHAPIRSHPYGEGHADRSSTPDHRGR